MRHTHALLFFLGLTCCAPRIARHDQELPRPVPPAAPTAGPVPPIQLWVGVEAWARSGSGQHRWDTVRQGQSLHSGDKLSLHVRVDEPAYVYVFYIGANGKIQPLHATQERLQPGREVRIPSLPQLLELDQSTGEENLLVLARRDNPLSSKEVIGGLQKAVDGGLLACKEISGQQAGKATSLADLSCGSLGSQHKVAVAMEHPVSRPASHLRPPSADPGEAQVLPPGFEATMGFFVTTGAQVQVDQAEGLSLFRFRLMHLR